MKMKRLLALILSFPLLAQAQVIEQKTPPASAVATAAGVTLNVTVGATTATNAVGAPINITAGTGNGTATGGAINITSGMGGATGHGGDVNITGANGGSGATGNNGGNINLQAGTGDAGASPQAASITIPSSASFLNPNDLTIKPSNASASSTAGTVAIWGGNNGGGIQEMLATDGYGNVVECVSCSTTVSNTNGFTYVGTSAGTPTGTPAHTASDGKISYQNLVPLRFDTTNNALWVYHTSWQDVANKMSAPTAIGTTFTLGAGTGACGTTSTLAGGATAGSFLCTGTAGASTIIVNLPTSTGSATSWTCWAQDETSGTGWATSAHSSTSATLKGTIATTSDSVSFGCMAY
jgi:hypothetical protein